MRPSADEMTRRPGGRCIWDGPSLLRTGRGETSA